MKNSKLLLTVGFVLGFAVGVFVWQRFVAARLVTENLQLREAAKQAVALAEENARLANERIDPGELKRLRDGQAELLRLRAQVAGLLRGTGAAREAITNKLADALSEMSPIAATNEWPAYTNAANVTATMDWEQVLVTGGWKTPGGKRIFFTFQPHLDSGSDVVRLEARSYEVPEDVLGRLGLDSLRVDSAAGVSDFLILKSSKALLNKLEKTRGVLLFLDKQVTSANRQQGQIAVTFPHKDLNGELYFTHNGVDWVSTISSNGRSVELTVGVQLHPFRPSSP